MDATAFSTEIIVFILGPVRMDRMLVLSRRSQEAEVHLSILQAVSVSGRNSAAGYLVPTVAILMLSVLVLLLVWKSPAVEGRRSSRSEAVRSLFYIVSSATIWKSCRVD